MNFPDVGGNKGSNGGPSGGTFLKLKDGEKIQGVFMGDPHPFRQHWVGGRSYVCVGKAECEHCKAGDKSKFRFRINFLTKVDGVWTAKVYENGYGMYLDLKEMHEDSYELPTTLVSLSRAGEGTETKYRVMPVRDNGGMKAADFKRLAGIPLNALSDKAEEAEAPELEQDANDDLPF